MEIDPKNIELLSQRANDRLSDDRIADGEDFEPESLTADANGGYDNSGPISDLSRPEHHLNRWKNIRKYYNDNYLELFSSFCNSDPVEDEPHNFFKSQIGAVTWTPEEKEKLFMALARHGRHELKQLSNIVGSKSPIDIKAYLDAARTAYVDRQLYMDNPKNISLAEIPAAVEVGIECENMLEQAADALNIYQEQFDIAAGFKEHGRSWLVDREVAARLDQQSQNFSDSKKSDVARPRVNGGLKEQTEAKSELQNHELFHLSTMLDISEQFCMNHSPDSLYPYWKAIAEPGQRPALTGDTLQMMFDLVVDHLKRVIKCAMNVANSRISSMTTVRYNPVHKLSSSDVKTALDILNLPQDSWEFWAKLPRRNHLKIVTGTHNRGQSRHQPVSYDDAEAALAPRRGRGRRRSMSIGSETSSHESNQTDDLALSSEQEHSDSHIADDTHDTGTETDSVEDEYHDAPDDRSSSTASNSLDSDGLDSPDTMQNTTRDMREALLEDAMEEFVEDLDRDSQDKEEKRLWQILGKRQMDESKEEDEEDRKLEPRPKMLRKTVDELRDWSCTYQSEWELFGHAPSLDQTTADSPEKGEITGVSDAGVSE